MSKDCWSQYVLISKANNSFIEHTDKRLFTVSLPQCWPESLALGRHIADVKETLISRRVDLELLIQIEIVDKELGVKQGQYVKDFYRKKLLNCGIFSFEAGVWLTTESNFFDTTIELFNSYSFPIVSTWGNWKDQFDSHVSH
jgi:hypothetical protein